MNVQILQMLQGAKNAVGLTVVIDVFRAFSLACYFFENGADTILPIGDIEAAYRVKRENPDFILAGERHGRKQAGFDYGNSPDEIQNINFTGKTIIHTTSAGTQGIAHAIGADEIITGSLVNAGAVAQYILQSNPLQVSLVCMGNAAKSEAEEDTLCAEYIKSLLERKPCDIDSAVKSLKTTGGRRFFDPANKDWAPENDFYLCTDLNRFPFVLKAEKSPEGLTCLRKMNIKAP
jgi:2-phosphosulfolactate phosphatase